MTKYYFYYTISNEDGICTAEARDAQGRFLGVVGEPTREAALLELKKLVLDLLVEYAEDGIHPLSLLADERRGDGVELTMAELFPVILRYKRILHKLTQSYVASRMGIRQQVYARLEKPGKANPTIATVIHISDVLDEDLLAFV